MTKSNASEAPIQHVSIDDFSAFTHAKIEFVPGINVLLGKNGSGKTHVMKLLYSLAHSLDTASRDQSLNIEAHLKQKLARVFRPDDGDIGRLVRRRTGAGKAKISVKFGGMEKPINFSITSNTKKRISVTGLADTTISSPSTIFIPSREVLAIFEGFMALYEKYDIAFDETYYDTCVALSAPGRRGVPPEIRTELIEPIEKLLGGQVVLEGARFYLRLSSGNMEAHLVSEGLRKVASLSRLILNGSIESKGVLFWDEPEANLNPAFVWEVVNFLKALARHGVQVIVSTHDYLFAKRLSTEVEFMAKDMPSVRFFSFHAPAGTMEIVAGDTLAALPQLGIVEEFVRLYELESKLESMRGEPNTR